MLPSPAELRRSGVRANGAQLQRWLNVLAWLTLAAGALVVLALAGLMVWLPSSGGASLVGSLKEGGLLSGGAGLGTLELLLILTALLVIVPTAFTFVLLRWSRELLGQFGRWALHQPVALPRAETLRRTLGNWTVFSQWAPVLVLGLCLLAGVVAIAFVPAADRLAGLLGAGFTLVYAVVLYAPVLVINWLTLGSVRRWMDLVGLRLRGVAGPPIAPAANLVGVWFIVGMVVLGLNALSVLPIMFVFALLSLIPGPAAQGAAPPGWFGLLVAGALLPSLLLMALHFMLLLWSRGFALAVAQEADARPAVSGPAPLPRL